MSEVEEVIVEEFVERAFSGRDFGFGLSAGLVVGGVITYIAVEKIMRTRYQEIAEQEIATMRDHYNAKELARQEKPEVEKIVEEQGYKPAPIPEKEEVAGSALNRSRQFPPEKEEDKEIKKKIVEREKNVFEEHPPVEDEWDYEEEVRLRRPDYPYVIHVDELGELAELDSLSWTYWEGDEILVNADNDVVTDVERCVGLANLDKFGHGSGDANTVYIRNVVLGIEIEIIKSEGKYEEEVLGLKHADESIRRRKRHFDDD